MSKTENQDRLDPGGCSHIYTRECTKRSTAAASYPVHKTRSDDSTSVGGDSGLGDIQSINSLDEVSRKDYRNDCDNKSRISEDQGIELSLDSLSISSEHEAACSAHYQKFCKLGYTVEQINHSIQKVIESKKNITDNNIFEYLVKLPTSDTVASQSTRCSYYNLKNSDSPAAATIMNPSEEASSALVKIVIDGSNVAMEHGAGKYYSCYGIKLSVDYFKERGHTWIAVFIPDHRYKKSPGAECLRQLRREGILFKAPSGRRAEGSLYDDRFLLKLAAKENAIIVSNDRFKDLRKEKQHNDVIERRVLPFTFVKDMFLPAEDPLGKKGPTLEQFLRKDPMKTGSDICPYGRKCTFGRKCKFSHPERENSIDSAIDLGSLSSSGLSSESSGTGRFASLGYSSAMSSMSSKGSAASERPRSLPPQSQGFTLSDPQPYPSHQLGLHIASHSSQHPPSLPGCRNPQPLRSTASYHPFQSEGSYYVSLPLDGQYEGMLPGQVSTGYSSSSENTLFYDSSDSVASLSGRAKLYQELIGMFSDKIVKKVMSEYPDETDKKTLVKAIMKELELC